MGLEERLCGVAELNVLDDHAPDRLCQGAGDGEQCLELGRDQGGVRRPGAIVVQVEVSQLGFLMIWCGYNTNQHPISMSTEDVERRVWGGKQQKSVRNGPK